MGRGVWRCVTRNRNLRRTLLAAGLSFCLSTSHSHADLAQDQAWEAFKDLASSGRRKLEISSYFAPAETAYGEIALSWSPSFDFNFDGPRVRLSSAIGIFRDRNLALPALLIPSYFAELSLGYRQRFGDFSTTTWLGLIEVSEDSSLPFTRFGARLTSQIVWSQSEDVYVGLFLRGETVRNAFSSVLNIGFLTPFDFKIGPEVGFTASTAGTGYRYGVGVTGFEIFDSEVGFSAGIGQRERGRPGFYGTVYVHRLF